MCVCVREEGARNKQQAECEREGGKTHTNRRHLRGRCVHRVCYTLGERSRGERGGVGDKEGVVELRQFGRMFGGGARKGWRGGCKHAPNGHGLIEA